MTALNSAIYEGKVFHQRERKVKHGFNYPVFMMYLDLDELDQVFSKSRFWSHKRFNLACMKDEDYLFSKGKNTIKESTLDFIKQETGKSFEGTIGLLTNLRYFGYLINPISCYFCFDQQDNLIYVIAEVTNTPWNEKKRYLLSLEEKDKRYSKEFTKQLHVSPFMENEMTYRWTSNRPASETDTLLDITLENMYQGERAFFAKLKLTRKEITGQNLNLLLIRFPFHTVKIALAIYWQAFLLLLKGVPVVKHVNPEELIDEL